MYPSRDYSINQTHLSAHLKRLQLLIVFVWVMFGYLQAQSKQGGTSTPNSNNKPTKEYPPEPWEYQEKIITPRVYSKPVSLAEIAKAQKAKDSINTRKIPLQLNPTTKPGNLLLVTNPVEQPTTHLLNPESENSLVIRKNEEEEKILISNPSTDSDSGLSSSNPQGSDKPEAITLENIPSQDIEKQDISSDLETGHLIQIKVDDSFPTKPEETNSAQLTLPAVLDSIALSLEKKDEPTGIQALDTASSILEDNIPIKQEDSPLRDSTTIISEAATNPPIETREPSSDFEAMDTVIHSSRDIVTTNQEEANSIQLTIPAMGDSIALSMEKKDEPTGIQALDTVSSILVDNIPIKQEDSPLRDSTTIISEAATNPPIETRDPSSDFEAMDTVIQISRDIVTTNQEETNSAQLTIPAVGDSIAQSMEKKDETSDFQTIDTVPNNLNESKFPEQESTLANNGKENVLHDSTLQPIKIESLNEDFEPRDSMLSDSIPFEEEGLSLDTEIDLDSATIPGQEPFEKNEQPQEFKPAITSLDKNMPSLSRFKGRKEKNTISLPAKTDLINAPDFSFLKLEIPQIWIDQAPILTYPVSAQSIQQFKSSWDPDYVTTFHQMLNGFRHLLPQSDGIYYTFVFESIKKIYPNYPNEARLLTEMLMKMAGLKVEIAFQNNNILLMVNTAQPLYQVTRMTTGNNEWKQEDWFFWEPGESQLIQGGFSVADIEPSNTLKPLNLSISRLGILQGEIFTHQLPYIDPVTKSKDTFQIRVDHNLVKILGALPQMSPEIYFDAPVSKEVYTSLIEPLKARVKGMRTYESLGWLLRFVQNAFPYRTDEEQFGREKAMFLEEALLHPYTDCEDRSVLFAILVKEVLGRNVIGLDFPGHMAVGVETPKEEARGARIKYKGKIYMACDPSYVNGIPGNLPAAVLEHNPKPIILKRPS